MTTPNDTDPRDLDPAANRRREEPVFSNSPTQPVPDGAWAEPPTREARTQQPVEAVNHQAPQHISNDGPASLFDRDLSELKARWNDVQAGFVDDPRQCVQQADGLVSDVVEQLTAGFSQARSRLEQQWARGEEASTEDLRVALKRYREFFDRLLAV